MRLDNIIFVWKINRTITYEGCYLGSYTFPTAVLILKLSNIEGNIIKQ